MDIFYRCFKTFTRVDNYNRLQDYVRSKNSVDLILYGQNFAKKDVRKNFILIKNNINSKTDEIATTTTTSTSKDQIISIDLSELDYKNPFKKIKEIESGHNNPIHIFTEKDYFFNEFYKSSKRKSMIEPNNIFFIKKHMDMDKSSNDTFGVRCSNCDKNKMGEMKIDNKLLQCNSCNTILSKELNQLLNLQKRSIHLITDIMNGNQLSYIYETTPLNTIASILKGALFDTLITLTIFGIYIFYIY